MSEPGSTPAPDSHSAQAPAASDPGVPPDDSAVVPFSSDPSLIDYVDEAQNPCSVESIELSSSDETRHGE